MTSVPGPVIARAPGPLNWLLSVIVCPAWGANVTVPGPGLLVKVAGNVAAQVQLAPPGPTELVPWVPPVFGPREIVCQVPPERRIARLWVPAAAAFTTPPPLR